MTLELRSELQKDHRTTRVGLFDGERRIGCAWETTVVPGLFNWCLFQSADGYGYASDGYSMEQACRDLVAAAHRRAIAA